MTNEFGESKMFSFSKYLRGKKRKQEKHLVFCAVERNHAILSKLLNSKGIFYSKVTKDVHFS